MSENEEGEGKPKLEINDLLCWYQNFIGTLNEPTLADLYIKQFTEKEIKAAKEILFSQLTNEISGEPACKSRKAHQKNVSPSRNYCSDIYINYCRKINHKNLLNMLP